MKQWTSEATDYFEGFLRQVAALAHHSGEDGDDIVSGLRDHVNQKLEDLGGTLVTFEQLRGVLAQVGSPEEIIAGGIRPYAAPPGGNGGGHVSSTQPAPSAAPPQVVVVQKAPRSRLFSCVVITLVAMLIVPVFIAVMGMLAAIVLPAMSRARLAARVAAEQKLVSEVLTQVAAAESEFIASKTLDADGDGVFDYGTLDQLDDAKLLPAELLKRNEGNPDTELDRLLMDIGGAQYQFVIVTHNSATKGGPRYVCWAHPTSPDGGRIRSFGIDNDLKILVDEREAPPASAIAEQEQNDQ